jgi:hypothetical protein
VEHSRSAPEPTKRSWSLGLAVAAVVAHAPALRGGFVLDDNLLLTDNPYVRSWAGLRELLAHELFVASAEPRFVPYYRPLSGLLNWASYQLLGKSALLQHALNLLLHAGVTLLLFRVARAWRVRPGVALAAALLFCVHPATAEVVAYIGGRQDMLGWLIGLCGMLLAGRVSCGWCALGLGFGASLLGAFCHELFIGLFVPLALLVGSSRAAGARLRAAVVVGGGGLAVAALLGLRAWLELLPFEAGVDGPLRTLRAAAGVALRLLGDVLLPTDLAVDVSLALPGIGLTSLLLLGSAVGAWLWTRSLARRRADLLGPLLAGLALSALSAGLHAGVALKYGIISDRYAYALLVGLTASLMVSAETWLPVVEGAPRPLLALLRRWGAPCLGLALLPLTWARDASWRDQKSLQLAMIADRPDDPESWLAEAMLAFAAGDVERAYPRCRDYQALRPGSDKANLCLGSWLLLHGRAAEAVEFLRPYALSRPGMPNARRTFLYALLHSGRYDELERTLRDWSAMFPGSPELREARAALSSTPRATPPH